MFFVVVFVPKQEFSQMSLLYLSVSVCLILLACSNLVWFLLDMGIDTRKPDFVQGFR